MQIESEFVTAGIGILEYKLGVVIKCSLKLHGDVKPKTKNPCPHDRRITVLVHIIKEALSKDVCNVGRISIMLHMRDKLSINKYWT